MIDNLDKKKILIFCNAPADIQYTLAIYENYNKTASVSVYCISVEGMYVFFKKLNLELSELVFIPSKLADFKNPLKIISEKIRLRQIYRKNLKNKYGYEICFFSVWYDWITFYLIGKTQKNNNITYINHYVGVNENCRNAKGIKERLRMLICDFLTNLKLKYVDDNNKILLFPYYNYGIKHVSPEIIDDILFDKYKFKLDVSAPDSILLLENDVTSYNIINDYKNTTLNIVKKFKAINYYIIVKGHPRMGHSKELDDYIDEFVPAYIPAEFIDISSIKYVFGLVSSTLAFYARKHKNVYSYIDDFDFFCDDVKMHYKNYLSSKSDNKIKFISVIKDEIL